MNPINVIAHQLGTGDGILAAVILLLAAWAVCRVLVLVRTLPGGGRGDRFATLAWQIGSLLGLEQAYEFTRGQIPHDGDVALLHAYRLLDLEWSHGFFIEERIERFFLQFHALMSAIDLFYIVAHVTVTIGVMVWIYIFHRQRFPFVRNMLMLTTAMALVAFYLYPTAPPRLLTNYGFVDPAVVNHLVGAGGAQSDSYTYNPYAAMPSLHVAYALVASWAVFVAQRHYLVRAAALIYPVAMSAAVVISGNHWLLDVAGAFATVLIARCILFGLNWLQTAIPPYFYRVVSP
jgi:hypothetical protein